jgi:hypothetical protein
MLARGLFSIVCLCVSSFSLAEVVAKEYPVKDFSEFVASGESEIEISQTGKEYLRIEADAEVMKYVKVDQTGKRVSVWAKKDGNFFNWFKGDIAKIKVILHVNKLEFLELSGAANAKVNDLSANELELDLSGAANADFTQLQVTKLDLDSSGAANARIDTIKAGSVSLELSGAANFDVKAESSVDQLHARVSGASNVRAVKLNAKHAYLDASGASHIDVSVTDEIKAEASGASSINYRGAPKAKTRATGASSINGQD